MTAVDLLDTLARRGVRLWQDGDALRYEGPDGAMTAELLSELRANKQAVLSILIYADDERPPRAHWVADPLASDDLPDRPLWEALLDLAYALDGRDPAGVFAALHCLRCCGATMDATRPVVTMLPPDGVSLRAMWAEWVCDHGPAVRDLLGRLTVPKLATKRAA